MKNIKLIIAKADILADVSLNTAYAGAKFSEEKGTFKRVATVEADELLLTKFWHSMAGRITEKLRNFITGVEISEFQLVLNLELSNAFDESMLPSIKTDIEEAFASGIISMWMSLTLPEKSQEWEQRTVGLLDRAQRKLCYRRKPVRN